MIIQYLLIIINCWNGHWEIMEIKWNNNIVHVNNLCLVVLKIAYQILITDPKIVYLTII